jgi:hypothetical protein
MEEMSIYDCKFVYVKGENNTVADTLSRIPILNTNTSEIAGSLASHPYLNPPYQSTSIPLLDHPPSFPFSTITALTSSHAASQASKITSTYQIKVDEHMITKIINGYTTDPWCHKFI